MPPTTHEKGHMWQATVGTTLTRRSPMGMVLDQGVRSPRYPSTMPKSLRHPRDKVCWPGPFLLFCLVPSGEDLVLSARWYSCPRMPISYGWCPQTQAGSLVKSVHHDHATIFARLLSPLCVTDVWYPLQPVVRCLGRRRTFLHTPLSTFWEWERRWLSTSKELVDKICLQSVQWSQMKRQEGALQWNGN